MSRFLPILLLAAGLVLLLTAFASAGPADVAETLDDTICQAAAAQASAEPSAPRARCWKKVGLGKVLPSCPTERAILTGMEPAAPARRAEPVFETACAPILFIATGFDPPPPKA